VGTAVEHGGGYQEFHRGERRSADSEGVSTVMNILAEYHKRLDLLLLNWLDGTINDQQFCQQVGATAQWIVDRYGTPVKE
jgi:hypothetical protein